MSVVVMRLVEAERAGVVFTVDPAGIASNLRIESVYGLGEKLVSGEVTPEAYILARSAPRRPAVDDVLDEAVEAAMDLERRFSTPQDVEWAHDGERLYIVQTQPITTVFVEDDGDGFDSVIGSDHALQRQASLNPCQASCHRLKPSATYRLNRRQTPEGPVSRALFC